MKLKVHKGCVTTSYIMTREIAEIKDLDMVDQLQNHPFLLCLLQQ